MTIPYTKMQGAGNDFIVIDNRTLKFSHEQLSQFAAQVCHRKFSVGADAVMAVDFPTGTADFRMRFYNADGTEAERIICLGEKSNGSVLRERLPTNLRFCCVTKLQVR